MFFFPERAALPFLDSRWKNRVVRVVPPSPTHLMQTLFIFFSLIHQVRTEINKEIEAVSKAADPLKILASADTMKAVGVQRPLLQVRNLQNMQDTNDIPACGE